MPLYQFVNASSDSDDFSAKGLEMMALPPLPDRSFR